MVELHTMGENNKRMKTLRHLCDECNSEFTLKYDEEIVESDPLHCPFCGTYIYWS
jgi:uncharacterized protein with PIN domain